MDENDLKVDLSYLQPPPEAYNIVHDDYYIKHNQGVKGTRKIYEHVQYDSFEENAIKELEDECKKQNVVLPPDWRKSDFLKMQYSGKCKTKESMKKLLSHLEWRANPVNHMLNDISIKFLSDGVIYTHGRDKQFRPIIILNAYMLDPKKHSKDMIVQALSFLMGTVKQYMFIPGKVENWVFVLETNKIGVFGLPLKTLGIVIECMSVNFCGCLDKMYILNPSSGLDFTWGAIQGLIDPETKEKINFVTAKTMAKLQERIDPSQLETKYGGLCPNLAKFWPPINLDLPGGYPPSPMGTVVIHDNVPDTPEIKFQKQPSPNMSIPLEEKQQDDNFNQQENPQTPVVQREDEEPQLLEKSNITNGVTFGKVSNPYFDSQLGKPSQDNFDSKQESHKDIQAITKEFQANKEQSQRQISIREEIIQQQQHSLASQHSARQVSKVSEQKIILQGSQPEDEPAEEINATNQPLLPLIEGENPHGKGGCCTKVSCEIF